MKNLFADIDREVLERIRAKGWKTWAPADHEEPLYIASPPWKGESVRAPTIAELLRRIEKREVAHKNEEKFTSRTLVGAR